MQNILNELNREVGIKGTLLLTTDGIVIASEFDVTLDQDVVAAIASSAVQSYNKGLVEIESEPYTRLVLNAAHGKMIFINCGSSYLVVVVDRNINVDLTMLAISSASRKVKALTS